MLNYPALCTGIDVVKPTLWEQCPLSPVHTSHNVEATLSNATSRTILSTKSNVCFDIVAGFGNNVKRNFDLSTTSKQIEHVQSVSTLSKGRNFTINSFDIVAHFGNKVERCFDIVAGVDGALLVRYPVSGVVVEVDGCLTLSAFII